MKARFIIVRSLITALLAAGLCLLLFIVNGAVLAKGQVPSLGLELSLVEVPRQDTTHIVRLMAFNVAKCFVDVSWHRLSDRQKVIRRLDAISKIVSERHPDILFLSEVATESGWGGVNQVRYLAAHTGLTNWAFGENMCFGVPFHRMISGNAILTRLPSLRALANPDLPGRRPFWITRNNRRVLIGEVELNTERIRLYSMHNDSFSGTNNRSQIDWLIGDVRGKKSILAGDFNATPASDSMKTLLRAGIVTGVTNGPFTASNVDPNRTIDYILGPTNWTVSSHEVITNDASDHCAVLTEFGMGL